MKYDLFRKSGIYKITNTFNGRFYIGSAMYLKSRRANHFSDLSRNKHHNRFMQNDYNKYGAYNYVFEVLEYCDKKDLIKREQYYLDFLKPTFNVNKTATSRIGATLSKETKEKISKSLRALNLKWTEEKRQFMKIKRTGIKRSKESIEKRIETISHPILQYSLNGDFIKEWKSATEVYKQLGYCPISIRSCLIGDYKKSSGFVWKYKNKNQKFRNKNANK